MDFFEKISLFLALLVGIIIFCWSAIPGMGGMGGSSLLPILYHFGIYVLLSSFLFLSSWDNLSEDRIFLITLILLIYAGLDELHQFWTPGRSCNLSDFSTDSIGILSGFLFILFCRLFRRKHS